MHGNNACPINQFSVWMPIELAASRQPSPEASSSPATVSASMTGNRRKVVPSSFSALAADQVVS